MIERLTASTEPASVNDIPLGIRAHTLEPLTHGAGPSSSQAPAVETRDSPGTKGKGKKKQRDADKSHTGERSTEEPPLFLMASLQNKNKRRGFKDALLKGVPPKIVFSTEESTDGHGKSDKAAAVEPNAMDTDTAVAMPAQATGVTTSNAKKRNTQPRLIPPSEKQEQGLFPKNMFVTSVDVEEGMWPRKKNKKKKKVREEGAWADEVVEAFDGGLPYDDKAAAAAEAKNEATPLNSAEGMEHAAVAARWDSLRPVTDKVQVAAGTTVAWKVRSTGSNSHRSLNAHIGTGHQHDHAHTRNVATYRSSSCVWRPGGGARNFRWCLRCIIRRAGRRR